MENVTFHSVAAGLAFLPDLVNNANSLPCGHLNLVHVPSTVMRTEIIEPFSLRSKGKSQVRDSHRFCFTVWRECCGYVVTGQSGMLWKEPPELGLKGCVGDLQVGLWVTLQDEGPAGAKTQLCTGTLIGEIIAC